jgi:hypothetical protein
MKVTEYELAREEIKVVRKIGVTKTTVLMTLPESVRQLMEEGYQPFGSAFLDRQGRMVQPMVKYS